jgi:hypothetical protein
MISVKLTGTVTGTVTYPKEDRNLVVITTKVNRFGYVKCKFFVDNLEKHDWGGEIGEEIEVEGKPEVREYKGKAYLNVWVEKFKKLSYTEE